MSQERPSQNKRKTSATYIKAETIASLAKQMRSSYNQKHFDAPKKSNTEGQRHMIEEQLLTPQSTTGSANVETQSTTGAAHVQTQSTTPAIQAAEEHVQLDFANDLTEDEQCEEGGPSIQTRKRGKTKMKNVHGRSERKLMVLNERNQRTGPTDDVIAELGSFLRTLARNATLCPLDILEWRKMDTKEDLWEYTKDKYDIPKAAKDWILEAISQAWRRHKYRLREEHFKPYENVEIRMQNAPEDVPISQFRELLKYWNSPKFQKSSNINRENRKKSKNPHTTGKTSFAVFCNNEVKANATFDPSSPKDIFIATRKRKPGRSYKCSDEDTTSKIAEMENIETQQKEDGNESVEPFASVMGPEHPGRLRLYGRGVTKTKLRGKVGYFEPSSNATTDLQRMEEKIQRLEEKIQEQNRTIRQEVVLDVLAQLQSAGHTLDANIILRAMGDRSTGEASSAQAAVQPIRRPSTSSNNQGQLIPGEAIDEEESSSEDLT